MHKIAIYHLETLLCIARLGTFRAAAERLNMTQPAISVRIRELESQVGVEIFRKDGRGVVLTARGRQFVKDCEPLLTGLETAILEAGNYHGATGIVRIAAGEIAASSCLPRFVSTVREDLPGVTLQVDLDLTATMVQNVLSGKRDIAFLAGPILSPGLRTAPVGEVGMLWLASPQVASQGGVRSGVPMWSIGEHSPIHRITRDSLNAIGLATRNISTCNNVRTMLEIVASGTGAAIFPRTMARSYVEEGSLVELEPALAARLHFEVAIRSSESDPIILELFRRAACLRIDSAFAKPAQATRLR